MNDHFGEFKEGRWQDFFNLVKQDKLAYGNVLDSNLGWWEASRRHPQIILTLTYEEMMQDIRKVIRRVADFLQIAVDTEVVEWVVEKTSFKSKRVIGL